MCYDQARAIGRARRGMSVEAISTFDIFKIGVGPSSSHTMGPWRAAQRFLAACRDRGVFDRIVRVRIDLYGSLAKTGRGHGTDLAVLLGLSGEDPVACDTSRMHAQVDAIRSRGADLPGRSESRPVPPGDRPRLQPPDHAAISSQRPDVHGVPRRRQHAAETYYSVGGGFVVQEDESPDERRDGPPAVPVRYGGRPAPPLP